MEDDEPKYKLIIQNGNDVKEFICEMESVTNVTCMIGVSWRRYLALIISSGNNNPVKP